MDEIPQNTVVNEHAMDATAIRMKQIFLTECEQKREQLNNDIDEYKKRIKDYQNVSNKLKENVKKLEIPINAPICAVGYFCDSHLIRTNEVLVNLGDDYLVECSSYSAQKLINRRIKEYQNTINDGMESLKLIDEKIKYTNSLFDEKDKDVVEICEPFDENAEKEFYEKRRRRKTEHISDKNKEDLEHKLLMSKLDKLEELEAENEEIVEVKNPDSDLPAANVDEEIEEVEEDAEDEAKDNINKLLQMPGVSEKDMARLLEYLKDCDLTSDEDSETDNEDESQCEDLDSDDYEEVSASSPVPIDYSSTSSEETKKPNKSAKIEEIENVVLKKEKTESPETVAEKKVESIDVKPKKKKKNNVRFAQELEEVKLFKKTDEVKINDSNVEVDKGNETKSILRSTEPTPVNRDALLNDHKEVVSMSSNCFPGEIVEKNSITVLECQPSTSKDPNPEFIPKVSRFRSAQRQKKSGGA